MSRQTRQHDEFHGFMDLPSEIRDLIYGHALIKGRVIVPNSRRETGALEPVKHYKSNDGFYYPRYKGLEQELHAMEDGRRVPIPLGLVQGVSRQVHDEASRVYFGSNQFILPVGEFQRPAYCNLLDTYGRSTEEDFYRDLETRTNNAPLFRDVSYAFDMRDHPGDNYANLYSSHNLKSSVDARTLSPEEALRCLHFQKNYDLEVNWVERIDCIKRMTLDRLDLAFDECYCAFGCCRKVGWVLDRLLHEDQPPGVAYNQGNVYSTLSWVARPPLVIEATGLVNEDEVAMAREKLTRLPGSEVRLKTTLSLDELADGADLDEHLSQRLLLD